MLSHGFILLPPTHVSAAVSPQQQDFNASAQAICLCPQVNKGDFTVTLMAVSVGIMLLDTQSYDLSLLCFFKGRKHFYWTDRYAPKD